MKGALRQSGRAPESQPDSRTVASLHSTRQQRRIGPIPSANCSWVSRHPRASVKNRSVLPVIASKLVRIASSCAHGVPLLRLPLRCSTELSDPAALDRSRIVAELNRTPLDQQRFVVVLDTGWPSEDVRATSLSQLRTIFDEVRAGSAIATEGSSLQRHRQSHGSVDGAADRFVWICR